MRWACGRFRERCLACFVRGRVGGGDCVSSGGVLFFFFYNSRWLGFNWCNRLTSPYGYAYAKRGVRRAYHHVMRAYVRVYMNGSCTHTRTPMRARIRTRDTHHTTDSCTHAHTHTRTRIRVRDAVYMNGSCPHTCARMHTYGSCHDARARMHNNICMTYATYTHGLCMHACTWTYVHVMICIRVANDAYAYVPYATRMMTIHTAHDLHARMPYATHMMNIRTAHDVHVRVRFAIRILTMHTAYGYTCTRTYANVIMNIRYVTRERRKTRYKSTRYTPPRHTSHDARTRAQIEHVHVCMYVCKRRL